MICSWNVLWSTVLTSTVMPDEVWKPSKTSCSAPLGTGSEAFEPKLTVPEAFSVPPPLLDSSSSPQPDRP